jgi:hypothetical protein
MAIEIVDLPIDSKVIFHSYASLPEGYMVFSQHSRWDLSFALRSMSSPHAAKAQHPSCFEVGKSVTSTLCNSMSQARNSGCWCQISYVSNKFGTNWDDDSI